MVFAEERLGGFRIGFGRKNLSFSCRQTLAGCGEERFFVHQSAEGPFNLSGIVHVAGRLEKLIRHGDLVARLGGDEFV
ncbi:MAG: hypothetical protein M1532_03090, partial [Nitrospirae bacterium]|nr:hypothetical protein [Nitrospirota bacterium]